MANLKEKANTYRLLMTSTPENLEMSWSRILTFGSKVLLAGYYYEYKKPCYFGAAYEFTGVDHTCEGEVRLTAVSEERFEDEPLRQKKEDQHHSGVYHSGYRNHSKKNHTGHIIGGAGTA